MVWVIGELVCGECEGVAQQLVFDGEERGHFGFAAGFERVGEGAAGDERGGRRARACRRLCAKPKGRAFCAGRLPSRPMVLGPRTLLPLWQEAWGEAAPRGGSAAVGEVAREFGDEPARSFQPDAGDGAEALAVGVRGEVRGEVRGDGGLDGGGFAGDVFLKARDSFAHDGFGGLRGALPSARVHRGLRGGAAGRATRPARGWRSRSIRMKSCATSSAAGFIAMRFGRSQAAKKRTRPRSTK